MIAWYYFTFLVSSTGTVLMNSQEVIKKIYFPKLILPFSKIFVGLVDLIISLILLLILMIIVGFTPPINLVFLPLFVILNIITGMSIGIWLCALTVRYRDFHHFIPYLVSFSIWLTPVFYPGSIIPPDYFYYIYINPMAGVIAGYRWCLLGDVLPSVKYIIGAIPVIFLFITGLYYFNRIEGRIVDII